MSDNECTDVSEEIDFNERWVRMRSAGNTTIRASRDSKSEARDRDHSSAKGVLAMSSQSDPCGRYEQDTRSRQSSNAVRRAIDECSFPRWHRNERLLSPVRKHCEAQNTPEHLGTSFQAGSIADEYPIRNAFDRMQEFSALVFIRTRHAPDRETMQGSVLRTANACGQTRNGRFIPSFFSTNIARRRTRAAMPGHDETPILHFPSNDL